MAPRTDDWLHITHDGDGVKIDAAPPGMEAWTAAFRWDEIERVCFEAADLFDSDRLYVFTTQRPESYVIPTEIEAGSAVWKEIIRRGIFDAKLAIEATTGTGLYCWPPPADQ